MRRCRWLATEAVQVPEIYMVGSNYNFGIVIVIKVTSVLCNLRERGEKLWGCEVVLCCVTSRTFAMTGALAWQVTIVIKFLFFWCCSGRGYGVLARLSPLRVRPLLCLSALFSLSQSPQISRICLNQCRDISNQHEDPILSIAANKVSSLLALSTYHDISFYRK